MTTTGAIASGTPDHRGERGWCGFCGGGDGHLCSTGDELSQYLPAAIRSTAPEGPRYSPHPHALPERTHILWCGRCLGGLDDKFVRYDDRNLTALVASAELRLKLDPMRWDAWEPGTPDERAAARLRGDDDDVHVEKLRLSDDLAHGLAESVRRTGLTPTGYHA